MKFKSALGLIYPVFTVVCGVLSVVCIVTKEYRPAYILVPTFLFFIWLIFDTYYIIEGDQLTYRQAFLKGKIDINSIYEIDRNKTYYWGLKPALAKRGLLIKFDKYRDIYLSPKDADKFVDMLIKVNPRIKVYFANS